VAHRVRDEHLIVALAVAATAALIAALLARSPGVASLAFACTGMGLSGIFPAVIAVGGRTHPRQVARVTSILIAGAGSGGIVIPWLMSALADRTDLTTGMAFYAVMCVVMVVLSVALTWRLSRHVDHRSVAHATPPRAQRRSMKSESERADRGGVT
jgi:fucose permease